MTELIKTSIKGVFEYQSKSSEDIRGSFLNLFRRNETVFKKSWNKRGISQVNLSSTSRKGTIRGLHLQLSPHSEAKIVRCINGKVWDVAVDLRTHSKTYKAWHAVELSAQKANAILIPEGCAHGFQVLEENSQLLYIHSGFWVQESESGIRWNDPTLNIKWPLTANEISNRDQNLPYLKND